MAYIFMVCVILNFISVYRFRSVEKEVIGILLFWLHWQYHFVQDRWEHLFLFLLSKQTLLYVILYLNHNLTVRAQEIHVFGDVLVYLQTVMWLVLFTILWLNLYALCLPEPVCLRGCGWVGDRGTTSAPFGCGPPVSLWSSACSWLLQSQGHNISVCLCLMLSLSVCLCLSVSLPSRLPLAFCLCPTPTVPMSQYFSLLVFAAVHLSVSVFVFVCLPSHLPLAFCLCPTPIITRSHRQVSLLMFTSVWHLSVCMLVYVCLPVLLWSSSCDNSTTTISHLYVSLSVFASVHLSVCVFACVYPPVSLWSLLASLSTTRSHSYVSLLVFTADHHSVFECAILSPSGLWLSRNWLTGPLHVADYYNCKSAQIYQCWCLRPSVCLCPSTTPAGYRTCDPLLQSCCSICSKLFAHKTSGVCFTPKD